VSTENLIRDALERHAEQAADPERIRAALPELAARRERQRRYGVLAAAGAAIAVAAAVAVPMLALRAGPGGRLAVAAPTPAASVTPSPSPTGVVTFQPAALRYSPTWLPAGLTEQIRSVERNSGGSAVTRRTWTSSVDARDNGPRLMMSLVERDGAVNVPDPGETVVDINGRSGGWYGSPDGYKSGLHWNPEPKTTIAFSQFGLGLDAARLVRIGRSVQPDQATMTVPLTLTWLPDGMTIDGATAAGSSPNSWRYWLSGSGSGGQSLPGHAGSRDVAVAVGTGTDAPDGGEAATIGGHPARFVTFTRELEIPAEVPRPAQVSTMVVSYLVVDLGQGLFLTVAVHETEVSGAPFPRADLERIAAGTQVSRPDMSWLGTR